MNGGAHQGDADHFPVDQEASERLKLEAFQPRPEAHIRRGRNLGLHAGQTLDRLDRGMPNPAQQKLPREQGAIERALTEDYCCGP